MHLDTRRVETFFGDDAGGDGVGYGSRRVEALSYPARPMKGMSRKHAEIAGKSTPFPVAGVRH